MILNKKFKEEILNYLKVNENINFRQEKFYSKVEFYFNCLRVKLKSKQPHKTEKFIKEYTDAIRFEYLPVLDDSEVTFYYDAWLSDKSIFNAMKILSELHPSTKYLIHSGLKYKYLTTHYNAEYGVYVLSKILEILKNRSLSRANQIRVMKYASIYDFEETLIGPLTEEIKAKINTRFEILFDWIEKLNNEIRTDSKFIEEFGKVIYHFKRFSNFNYATPDIRNFIQKLNEVANYGYIMKYSFDELLSIKLIFDVSPKLFDDNWVGNQKKKESDLFKLVFHNYRIPPYFIQNFYFLSKIEKDWLIFILQGGKLTRAKKLPINLSNAASKFFWNLSVKHDFSITEALIYSTFRLHMSNDEFIIKVMSRIRNLKHLDFWVKIMSNFCSKGLKIGQIIEVMDYFEHKILNNNMRIDWKAKKIENLLLDIKKWHEEMYLTQQNIPNILFPEPSFLNHQITFKDVDYIFVYLRNTFDLLLEGRFMKHCVFSYEPFCQKGKSEIYSLRMINAEESEIPLVTIEIREGEIVQAKGKYNRAANAIEKKLIKKWVKFNQTHQQDQLAA